DELYFQTWLSKQASLDGSSKGLSVSLPQLCKKPVARLQIDNLPGYDRLNDAEKELCSEARLVPQAYLDFSRILIAENTKHGFLKLAQARTLIKIDVNKTRKLYDFLILHGHITKDPV
ncbi:Transcriptional adapter 2-alpha, partial [Bulinus truncatus]